MKLLYKSKFHIIGDVFKRALVIKAKLSFREKPKSNNNVNKLTDKKIKIFKQIINLYICYVRNILICKNNENDKFIVTNLTLESLNIKWQEVFIDLFSKKDTLFRQIYEINIAENNSWNAIDLIKDFISTSWSENKDYVEYLELSLNLESIKYFKNLEKEENSKKQWRWQFFITTVIFVSSIFIALLTIFLKK